MKLRVQSSSATSSTTQPDDLQSQPSTSTNQHNYIQAPMKRSGLETNSLTASLWTSSMISAESNTPSDLKFYRRASWLEEYAAHRVRSIEDRSEARRIEAAATRRSGLGHFLTSCLPCSSRTKTMPKQPKSVAYSSQTSLTSMLEKAEEEEQRISQIQRMGPDKSRNRPQQHLIMITSSL